MCLLFCVLKAECVCFLQAAGVRLGTVIEMSVTLLASMAVAFGYSWITAFVVVGLIPILAVGSVLYFSLAAGRKKSSNKGLKEASEVSAHLLSRGGVAITTLGS